MVQPFGGWESSPKSIHPGFRAGIRRVSDRSLGRVLDPSKLYKYTLSSATEVEAFLTRCAGRRAELGN
jgi:pectate lyase